MRRRALLALLVVVSIGCTGGGGGVTTLVPGEGADSPTAAVESLRSLLAAGDFASAGSLAMPGQAALVSLSEGASPAEVAAALEDGDLDIAANFWGGFAQGAGESFAGPVMIEDLGVTEKEGVRFFLVGVTPESGLEQVIVTREAEGQRVDLFASFGAGLAGDLMSPVEILLSSPNAESIAVLAALQEIVPSLLLAAEDRALSPEAAQEILQLVELITRAG